MRLLSYMSHAWKRHDWLASTKGPYELFHCRNHLVCAANYGLDHYDIALYTLLSVEMTKITWPLVIQCATTWPLLLWGSIKPIAFHLSNWAASSVSHPKVWHKKKGNNKALQMCWCPLTSLCLTGLAEGVCSGPSHRGRLGSTQCTHSSSASSLSPKILSPTLSQG